MAGDIVETIEHFWKVRLAGDKAAIRELLSDEAVYEMVGAKSFADADAVGPSAAAAAADRLVDDFKFHSQEQLTTVVSGRKVAMVSRIEVSFRNRAPMTTEICDLWEFDGAGKIASLKQFVDTDLVRRMIAGEV